MDLNISISGAMGSTRSLPALYMHSNGTILSEEKAAIYLEGKGEDKEEMVAKVKERRKLPLQTGQCHIATLDAAFLASLSIQDLRLLFERKVPLKFRVEDVFPSDVLTSLHSDLTLASLVEAHGGDEIYAAEIPSGSIQPNSTLVTKRWAKRSSI